MYAPRQMEEEPNGTKKMLHLWLVPKNTVSSML